MTAIDRRALFASGAAAALLAASGVSLAAEPRSGGRLRLAVPREDDSLKHLVRGAVFDTLTEIAPNGVLQGELASSWSGSEDARTWQLNLRDDVIFHNGRQMQARDVVASLLAHEASGRIRIRSAEATGRLRLRLELEQGNPDFPILLANQDLAICADGHVDLPLDQAVGTGCYEINRYQADRHFLGHRVSSHYKTGRAGWVESVEAVVIPDAEVRAEALRDGYVDVAVLPRPDSLRMRNDLILYPSADDMMLAANDKVGVPQVVSARNSLDDGRLAERWWMG